MEFFKKIWNGFGYIFRFLLNNSYGNYLWQLNPNQIFNNLKTSQSLDTRYTLHGTHLNLKDESDFFLTDAISKKSLKGNLPSKLLRYKNIPNFDIKYIWDISRFQFFDEIFARTQNKDDLRDIYLKFLGVFSKSNKPYSGPNWLCTMDVAIRGVNIAYYYDLLFLAKSLNDREKKMIANILASHLLFIEKNLEWVPQKRGNHYLSNICGLLVIASKFNLNEDTKRIFRFSFNEFFNELDLQFQDDGTYYENSTAYHRLAVEMVFYTVVYLNSNSNLIKEFLFSELDLKHKSNCKSFDEILSRILFPFLKKALFFCKSITLPDGSFHQVGDNDSGRFIVRDSVWLDSYKDEYKNDYISRSFFTLIRDVDHYLAAHNFIETPPNVRKPFNFKKPFIGNLIKFNEFHFPIEVKIESLSLDYYQDFGLVVWKSNEIYLSFRCGKNNGKYVHAHEDQLSVEIYYKGQNLVRDKGSFCYTRNRESREIYRSQDAHFVPLFIDKRQGEMPSLFNFKYNGDFKINSLTEYYLEAIWEIDGRILKRSLSIKEDGVIVTDYVSEKDISLVRLRQIEELDGVSFSPEYGCN